jgi:Outer membrane protein beta-barrel domain
MKTLFTSLIVVICSVGLCAQGLDFGIKAGVNIANQNYSDDFNADTKAIVLFHGGVFVTWMFTEKLGLQPEVLFSMQGSKEDGYDYKVITNYVNIPVLVRYDITDMFSVHAGPQFGVLLSAESEYQGGSQDLKEYYKGSDIGIAIGAEADDLPLNLGVGVRYIFGLTNVAEENIDFADASVKNGVLQIYVKFRLKKGTED